MKKFTLIKWLFAGMIFTSLSISQMATAQNNCQGFTTFGLYSISRDTKELVFFDTLGNKTTIGQTGIKSLSKYDGMDLLGNDLYFLGKGDSLYKISVSSGKATYISTLTVPGNSGNRGPAISFSPSGELYVFDELSAFAQGTLRKVVDISSGLTTTVGTSTSGLPSILAMDFDSAGTLWITDECCQNKLHKLNTITGTFYGSSSQSINRSFPSELDYTNGKLWGISINDETVSNTTTFYSINKNTGASKTLFTVSGLYIGLAGRNKPVYTDTVYITQTVTVTSTITIYQCNGTVTGTNTGKVEDNSINVYPNPTNSSLSVVSSLDNVASVDVLDNKGAIILTTYFPKAIDVSAWPNGLYMLKAKNSEGDVLKTFKIMKE